MSLNNRLAKLEKQQPPAPKVNPAITDEMYNRSMEALAAALGMITGATVTARQAEQAIKELNYEQLR